ncbi:MAG TPA: hypothetical protein H9903_18405 [Candidatus Aquabacterium excrementipullorum]|nr:hypothetical protein [Candidatus Aquabacterium excrementipullorum]
MLMAGCGGGGANHTTVNVVYKKWQGTVLTDMALPLVPGGGHALVGDAPQIDWLNFVINNAVVDLRQTSLQGGTWQTASPARIASLHGAVFNDSTTMARAGDWTVIVARVGGALWAQFHGPGVTSVQVPLPATTAGQVHAVVDASGKARVFWGDSNGTVSVTRAMHFDAATFVDDGQVSGMPMDLLRVVAGPDGKGWLLYQSAGAHYVRTVDAILGLGTALRVDDAAKGGAEPHRQALAESTTRFSTLGLQGLGGAAPCVGVGRLDGNTWSGVTCVNTDASQGVGGGFMDLAVEPGGRAVVVWSGGADDDVLYGTVRRANGTWTAPRQLVAAPSGGVLYSVQAKVHTDGSAVVVFRQAGGTDPVSVPYAVMFDASAETWGSAARIDAFAGESAQVSVAFNSRGEPGVLNFAKANGQYQVRFATRRNGQWSDVALMADVALPSVTVGGTTVPISLQRLMPQGEGGWVAFWELNSLVGYGHRLVAASYQ